MGPKTVSLDLESKSSWLFDKALKLNSLALFDEKLIGYSDPFFVPIWAFHPLVWGI